MARQVFAFRLDKPRPFLVPLTDADPDDPFAAGARVSAVFVIRGENHAKLAPYNRTPDIPTWEPGKFYVVGNRVGAHSGNVYDCTVSGLASSVSQPGDDGPSGTGTNIVDGDARWDYVEPHVDPNPAKYPVRVRRFLSDGGVTTTLWTKLGDTAAGRRVRRRLTDTYDEYIARSNKTQYPEHLFRIILIGNKPADDFSFSWLAPVLGVGGKKDEPLGPQPPDVGEEA